MTVGRVSYTGAKVTVLSLVVAASTMALGACGGASTPASQAGAAGATAGNTTTTGSSAGAGGTTAAGAAGATLAGSAGAAGAAMTGAAGSDPSGLAGASGAAGAAGSSGAAGSIAVADAGAAAGASGGDAAVARTDYVCTELIGLWVASQWWGSFEKGVPGDKWEFMFQHHGYLELFADPASPFWNNAVTSKCTAGAATPDRIVFLPFSLDQLTTLDQWVTNLNKVVETMKGKFPNAKRIELMTTLRSPGNMMCPGITDKDTIVQPYVDQAIQMVADASGGFVAVGPKIEVGSCSWWAGDSHDLTGAGNTGAGQLLATYYQTH